MKTRWDGCCGLEVQVTPGVVACSRRTLSTRYANQGAPSRPCLRYLRTARVEAAHAAVRPQNTCWAAPDRRLAARRGRKRAWGAFAHTILTRRYNRLKRQEPYRELGGAEFAEHDRPAVEKRRVGQLRKLGDAVALQPSA